MGKLMLGPMTCVMGGGWVEIMHAKNSLLQRGLKGGVVGMNAGWEGCVPLILVRKMLAEHCFNGVG